LLLAGLLFLAALVVVRPVFISEIMARLPLLKSMRWPFRELLQFQFFLHLLLVVRPPGFTARNQLRLAVFSTLIYVVPMLAYKIPPTLNTTKADRHLVLSGELGTYWRHVQTYLRPGDRIAVLLPLKLYLDHSYDIPFSLLPAFNYAGLAGVPSAGGYSQTPPKDQLYLKTFTVYPFGVWQPEQKAALLAEQPALKFVTLESIEPLRISLGSGDGPDVDLTPFIPDDIKKEVAESVAAGKLQKAAEKKRGH
jgi:hypothetical protein